MEDNEKKVQQDVENTEFKLEDTAAYKAALEEIIKAKNKAAEEESKRKIAEQLANDAMRQLGANKNQTFGKGELRTEQELLKILDNADRYDDRDIYRARLELDEVNPKYAQAGQAKLTQEQRAVLRHLLDKHKDDPNSKSFLAELERS